MDRDIRELERGIVALSLRCSAVEWVVENALARELLTLPPADANAFLAVISHAALPDQGSGTAARTDLEDEFQAYVDHMLDRVGAIVRAA